MSLADTIIAMAAAGCSAEQMAEVARQFKQQDQDGLAGRRANDAERQRRRRAKAKEDVTECHVTSRDVTLVTRDPPPPLSPLKERSPPITPSKENNPPISTPTNHARDARSLAVRAAFDAFWRHWPHKVGKPAAEKAFAKCSGEIEAILLGIDRYIRDKPPDRPWLNPATFLNQRRWEDAPAEISQAPRHEPPRKISAITQAIMKLEAEINETQISRDSPALRQIPVNGELISGGFGVEDQELPRNLERLFG